MKPECFIDPLSTPLGRRSSYLCFANDNKGEAMLGKSTLYLSTCRVGGAGMTDLSLQVIIPCTAPIPRATQNAAMAGASEPRLHLAYTRTIKYIATAYAAEVSTIAAEICIFSR